MMLPVALGVMASVGRLIVGQVEGEDRPERLRFGAALMLVITYGITVGGLLLPIGTTPPNAIVYSSGMLPVTRMVETGAVFDLIGVVLCVVGVAVMARVVGLA